MMFSVLALDYDGTVARDGVVDPEVRRAIAEVRHQGVTVVIVTGRILESLRKVAGDLRFVDAVVAENGAVVLFPQTGRSLTLAPAASDVLVADLRRRGVHIDAGQCVIEAEARAAPQVLEAIRTLELPYVIVFNRGRLMTLPTGVNKASGLREALRTLRLSSHNAIAIGDAENDHDLLEASELGVAVQWGSPALQKAADEVLPGASPTAIAAYIRDAAARVRIAPERVGRRHVTLGQDADGRTVSLAVRGWNVLVAGDPNSGKSWVAGLLSEQLIQMRYSVCVIDPEGDYAGLETLPGVVRIGGTAIGPTPRELRAALRYPDVNVVVDLSQMPHVAKWSYVRSLLAGIKEIRQRYAIPHRIVLDEAHYLLADGERLLDLDLELGGYTLVTYQPSRLHPDLLRAVETMVVTRLTDPHELAALASWCAQPEECRSVVLSLARGHAAILPMTGGAGGTLTSLRLAPRLTTHVRHREKYIDVPVAEVREFVVTEGGQPAGPRVGTLRGLIALLTSRQATGIDGHLRRHDISRWIADVFADGVLASRIHALEDQYRQGAAPDVTDALIEAIRTRYDVTAAG